MGSLLRAKAAHQGKGGFVRAPRLLRQKKTMLFLLWLMLFEYMHVSLKSETPKVFSSNRLFNETFCVNPHSDQFQR